MPIFLDAQSVDETAVARATAARPGKNPGYDHSVDWSTDVTSGAVVIECASSAGYTGEWMVLGTVTFSGTAPKQNYLYTEGRPGAFRHRIVTVVAGGAAPTVTTRVLGAF